MPTEDNGRDEGGDTSQRRRLEAAEGRINEHVAKQAEKRGRAPPEAPGMADQTAQNRKAEEQDDARQPKREIRREQEQAS
eukprot:2769938-Lingulodinium_polyedra.AAC.1